MTIKQKKKTQCQFKVHRKKKRNKSKQKVKRKKQTVDYSSPDTDLDSNLYTNSGDNPWNEGESDDDLFIVHRNKTFQLNKANITILSEVKNSAENCNYLDVTKVHLNKTKLT